MGEEHWKDVAVAAADAGGDLLGQCSRGLPSVLGKSSLLVPSHSRIDSSEKKKFNRLTPNHNLSL